MDIDLHSYPSLPQPHCLGGSEIGTSVSRGEGIWYCISLDCWNKDWAAWILLVLQEHSLNSWSVVTVISGSGWGAQRKPWLGWICCFSRNVWPSLEGLGWVYQELLELKVQGSIPAVHLGWIILGPQCPLPPWISFLSRRRQASPIITSPPRLSGASILSSSILSSLLSHRDTDIMFTSKAEVKKFIF